MGIDVNLRDDRKLEEVIGVFVNTLVLKMEVNEEESIIDLLYRIENIILEAIDNKEYPFNELVKELGIKREMSRSPLFDVLVTLDNVDKEYICNELKIENTLVMFDLQFEFYVIDSDKIRLWIDYNTDLFNRDTIEIMIKLFEELAYKIINEPKLKIKNIDILNEYEDIKEENIELDFEF